MINLSEVVDLVLAHKVRIDQLGAEAGKVAGLTASLTESQQARSALEARVVEMSRAADHNLATIEAQRKKLEAADRRIRDLELALGASK